MARLLVNCSLDEDFAALRDFAESTMGLDVTLARTDADVANALKHQTVHLLLRHSHRSVDVDLEFARTLRRMGYARPVVMITKELGEPRHFTEDHGFCLLEQPFDLKALKGLMSKLLTNRSVPQQISRRYAVSLQTTLETFISGAKLTTQMFNVSNGGAYLELSERPEVRVGDLVRLRVWLDEIERERVVSGRVVWLTGRGHSAGGFGVGLKFMKSSDLYRKITEPPR